MTEQERYEIMLDEIIDLKNKIKDLQAENDNLKNDELPRCKDALRRANEIGMELQAENERLNKEVDRLSQVVLYNDGVTEMKVEEAKAEAYKECIEKVKEYIDTYEHLACEECECVPISKETLDNLLKELVGEEK